MNSVPSPISSQSWPQDQKQEPIASNAHISILTSRNPIFAKYKLFVGIQASYLARYRIKNLTDFLESRVFHL